MGDSINTLKQTGYDDANYALQHGTVNKGGGNTGNNPAVVEEKTIERMNKCQGGDQYSCDVAKRLLEEFTKEKQEALKKSAHRIATPPRVVKAVIFNPPTLKFADGKPTRYDLDKLKAFLNGRPKADPNDPQLQKILSSIFTSPFTNSLDEAKKIQKIADMINGKIALPPQPNPKWIRNLRFEVECYISGSEPPIISQQRAEAVVLLLGLFGVDPARLHQTGYNDDEKYRLVPEDGLSGENLEQAQNRNRRCNFIPIGEMGPSMEQPKPNPKTSPKQPAPTSPPPPTGL